MGKQQLLERLVSRYTPKVANYWGVRKSPISIGVGRLPPENPAAASFQDRSITFNRQWLKRADTADIRGAVIHELTHALGVGDGKTAKQVENMADATRLALNPRETPGWQAPALAQRIAERRGESMTTGTRGNGPTTGRDPRRKRNTQANYMSKVPLLGPGQTFGYAAQAASLVEGYQNALASIRAQQHAIRGQAVAGREAIRADRVAGTAEAESAALATGAVGSSGDLANRAGVVAQAQQSRVALRGETNAALAQQRIAMMQAQTELSSGILGLQADKRLAQIELANQQFMQDQADARAENYQQAYLAALRRILARGKNVNGQDPRSQVQAPGYVDPRRQTLHGGVMQGTYAAVDSTGGNR